MGYIYASIPVGAALILLFAMERIVRVWSDQEDSRDATPA
jgi:TRAP-type C4-dicarboxylate transport system permease small subunit